jgi:hypothetical protein
MRKHLSYANVVATLALICAVGGGGFAVAGKKAPKGKLVRVTKSSDISPKGVIRNQRIGKENIALNAIGANQLGELRRYLHVGNGTAACPSGERLISGGASFSNGVIASQPASFGPTEGWFGGGATANGSVHAICLAP